MAIQTFYSWNVNGIRAAEKKGFLDWLEKANADYIAVQETKAHPDQVSDALKKHGVYTSFWHAAEKKGYSGVATFTKNPPRKVLQGFSDTRFDHEGRVVITEFDRFVLFNIYFPNGGRGPEWVQHKLAFYRAFLEKVLAYKKAGVSVIVCGDVNTAYAEIDLSRPKENSKTSGFLPEERIAVGEFYSAGLIDTFRLLHPEDVTYSWWDVKTGARERNIGWRIDYFYVSEDLRNHIVEAKIHTDVYGSDHAPISLTLDL